ncbi:MAG: hypothetical protein PUF72_05465 [Clostridiales bacterium]|nr:hypothetical protein [Clostridiales bacterium]
MSMMSSYIYGFGFASDCAEEKLVDFMITHKDSFCVYDYEFVLYDEMLRCVKNGGNSEALFESYSCDVSGKDGEGAVISNIMSRETGICFSYCPSDDSCGTLASVVFEVNYPWHMNETEKNLTEEQVRNVCKKYMEELGISDEPNYLSLEYYG